MSENKPLSRGDLIWEKTTRRSYAKIEFIAVQELVEQKRSEGYSIKLIYEALSKAGYISMGYTTFCDYLRGKGERLHGKKKAAQKQTPNQNRGASSSASPKKIVPADKNEPFKIERVPLEELI